MVTAKTRNRIIDALMALAAERDWGDIGLEDLAGRAGVTLSQLRTAYDGRVSVLADFARRTDEAVLASVDPDMRDEPPRERLFDILFARLEALAPYRAGLRRMAAAGRDPLLALALNRIVATSMAWMLTAAGVSASGTLGALRAQGLAVVWGRVLRVWFEDEDPGLSRTMAELDKRLREAERTIIRINRFARMFRGRRRKADAAPPEGGNRPGARSGNGAAAPGEL